MNGSRASVEQLVLALLADLPVTISREVLLCPSFVFLDQVANLIAGSSIQLGAQNLSTEKAGAFTGEISGAMLAGRSLPLCSGRAL